MFKNELIVNIAHRLGEEPVKTVDKLRNIEEEIEKDYSKYVNEYGLTKTAFAKAVNLIRDKQGQKTARVERLGTQSNEKKRMSAVRNGSTSQPRKLSNNRI